MARTSWTMPIAELTTSTTPKAASCQEPVASTTTSRAPSRALNRVNTFARTIWARVRVVASPEALPSPRCNRSAASACDRPAASATSTPSRTPADGRPSSGA